ncbi:UDP-3-O-(3-hydroxymyristoyl)glucosamine N-acyltransferase [Comamonas sp. J-3]|uniref:UDP-3-O-(3-hydroxymyristoyl)glucosamine N-acyltransferase n=1 Tax=Comamonas trifloxystrobinivorans TaxID=3350256 RepID=UPI00372786AE
MSLQLGQIVDALGGRLEKGDRSLQIEAIASLEDAGPHDISFLSNPRLHAQMQASRAACVAVSERMEAQARERAGAYLVVDDPYLFFARLTQLWRQHHQIRAVKTGVHPSAVVEEGAQIHPSASVGPLCHVGAGAVIGADSVLTSRVTLGAGCVLGQRVLVQPGAVIGGDGFGFANDKGRWIKIEQLGNVRIGDDVEIGSNTCIDRGALQDTVIANGVKIDNQVQIGHNVEIGENSAMAGCTGIAGSAKIGRNCTIGGAGMILGHLEIADNVHISAATVVSRSIKQPGHYTGFFPIDDNGNWEKNAATLKHLHALRDRIKALEQTQKNG